MSGVYPVAFMCHDPVEGKPGLFVTPSLLHHLGIFDIEASHEIMLLLKRPFSSLNSADNRLFLTDLDINAIHASGLTMIDFKV